MDDLDGIYRQYAKTVYRFLLAKTGSEQLSEELTQETFYQAVKSIGRYDGSCQISTWLCGIARNVLQNHRRRQLRQPLSLEEIPEPAGDSAEDTVLEGMGRETILASIHALSDPGREILYLRLLGGLSFREIGSVLAQSENWARVNFYRAKQLLIKELRRYEENSSV